jgi:Fic family protein
MQAEVVLEARYGTGDVAPLYSEEAIRTIHRELHERLPPDERVTEQGDPIESGALRARDVAVGQHVAPTHRSVPDLLARWATAYREVRAGEASVVAAAAAHQRLGWIHPFLDGNGRVMRLHTHLVLSALGHSNGLWSPLRGFARSVERYYALLAAADEPRRGDLDSRGNLSEQALADWIGYVLDVCLDQIEFMRGILEPSSMDGRIAACLMFEEATLRSGVRREALRPLHYLFLTGGALERGEFKQMTGLGDRTAVSLVSALLRRGLLKSDSPQGRVRFGLPQHALRFYFPRLWPEAEADAPV